MSPEAVDRLALVANYRKGAKSAIVEAALDRYLNPERNRLLDDGVLRRLDGLSRSVSLVARDVAIATETLSLFVRYFLTITPPLPQAEQDAASALGKQALRGVRRPDRPPSHLGSPPGERDPEVDRRDQSGPVRHRAR